MGSPAQGLSQCAGSALPLHLTMNGTVIVTPHKAVGRFQNIGNSDNSLGCDLIRDTLLAANWVAQLPINAVGGLSAPFGWGFTGFQRHVASIGFSTGGTAYLYYDPATEAPPSGFIGGYVIYAVPIGATSAKSQSNLISAINTGGVVVGLAINPTSISLTAVAPGTLGNGVLITGNGSISLGSSTSGGGWVLESRSQFDLLAKGNIVRFTLAVRTDAPGQGNMQFNISVLGTPINFYLAQGDWEVIADDVQAYFISRTPFHAGDIYVFNNFCWLSSLFIPDNIPLTIAAFVSQPGNLPANSTIGAPGGMVVDQWVGGDHTTGSIAQQGWSMGMFYSGDGPVADPADNSVFQPPYVMMHVPATGESRLIGNLWDCFLTSIPQPLLQQFDQLGFRYRVIATQGGPAPGSLLMMTGELDNLGTPASGNPPKKDPQYASGNAQMFVFSPTQGIISAPVKMFASGPVDPFDPAWVGKAITINGVQYTVVAVLGGISLYFSPAPPAALSNVSWSILTN